MTSFFYVLLLEVLRAMSDAVNKMIWWRSRVICIDESAANMPHCAQNNGSYLVKLENDESMHVGFMTGLLLLPRSGPTTSTDGRTVGWCWRTTRSATTSRRMKQSMVAVARYASARLLSRWVNPSPWTHTSATCNVFTTGVAQAADWWASFCVRSRHCQRVFPD